MRSFLFGFVAFVTVGLSPLLALAAQQGVGIGVPVLVIANPWYGTADEVISRAGLVEISPERAPLGALTMLDDPDDASRLRKNGAWFVIDGELIAQICGQ